MELEGADAYGKFRRSIEGLRAADNEDHREVLWLDDHQRIGVARDRSGRVEIFITGPALSTTSAVIATNLVHDTWRRKDAAEVVANRLLLPAAPHFDAVAAFLCAELMENGVLTDAQGAFRRSEAVIELAIHRLRLQGEALIGLLGELLVMATLLDRAPTTRTAEILQSWHGYVRSARDFQLGSLGLEVKTTRSSASSHKVQGVHQVEPGHGVNGALETAFFLVSIGVETVAADEAAANASSLPDLVDGIVRRIQELAPPDHENHVADLLLRIRTYGGGDGEGYDHSAMKHRLAFGQQWRTTFARGYDMADPAIKTLRSSNLVEFSMVDPASVEFVLRLPNKVDGDLNPVVGLTQAVDIFIDRAWGA